MNFSVAYIVQTNIIALIIIVAAFFLNKREHHNSTDAVYYNALSVELSAYCLVDIAASILSNISASSLTIAIEYVVDMVYIMIPLFISITWDHFVAARLDKWGYRLKRSNFAAMAVMIIAGLACLTTPFTHFAFSITAEGKYVRGIGAYLVPVLAWCYILFIAIKILTVRKRIDVLDGIRLSNSLLFFAVPPVIASAIQIMFYGLSIAQMGFACAFASLFLSDQHNRISRDSLTGLCNRRECDNYIYRLRGRHDNVIICMIDVNKFKSINDTYGHRVGDDALRSVGKILTRVCSGELDGFFAGRYGGDEFLIIGKNENANAEKLGRAIVSEVEKFNSVSKKAYTIRLDFGIAAGKYSDDMMKRADANMYTAKNS